LINTVEVLLCMRLIISEVFESWKSVQRDVRRKQQQQYNVSPTVRLRVTHTRSLTGGPGDTSFIVNECVMF